MLGSLTGITVESRPDRLTLQRGDTERLEIELGRAPMLGLADLTFTGNEYIAMLVFDALVPLFGPLEFQLGEYTDIVDGTEPGGATRRYQAHMRAKVEALMGAMQGLTEIFAPMKGAIDRAQEMRASPAARRARRQRSALNAAILVTLLLVCLGYWYWDARLSRHGVGEDCTASKDCRSKQCLPRGGGVHPMMVGSAELGFAPRPADTGGPGVCTETCSSDADCPDLMACHAAMEWGEYNPLGSRVMVCMPRAWDADESPGR